MFVVFVVFVFLVIQVVCCCVLFVFDCVCFVVLVIRVVRRLWCGMWAVRCRLSLFVTRG